MINKSVTIFNEKSHSIKRRHPWIFSGAIKSKSPDIKEGDLVIIQDENKKYLGVGYYQQANISVKVLCFHDEEFTETFWARRISQAFTLRQQLRYVQNDHSNAYRLVHGEGDSLPGLIIDIYDDTAIIQCHSLGMYLHLEEISQAIKKVLSDSIQHIYNKSKDTLSTTGSQLYSNFFITGDKQKVIISENGIRFEIDIVEGQKTGFFLDQRNNRKLLQSYVKGKSVLNTFCYTGGFSLYALNAGATHVSSVDSSQKALNQLSMNLDLNDFNLSMHDSLCIDVLPYINNLKAGEFDVMILDPPAFAKNINKRHNAVQAYKRLNAAALSRINSQGILFTFSCSQVVNEELFYNTIMAAGIESNRNIKILHKLHQAPDHPVNMFHPEGSYLKGMVLQVE